MIPKIIHYIWVGNKEKPQSVLNCISSWKKQCPHWEIKEWDNSILQEINNAYVQEAFNAKKWAFVSDYIRLYVLKKYGGVYCDTDLEITQNLDRFLNNDFFMGYEIYRGNLNYQTALIGAIKEHDLLTDLLNEYKNIHFEKNGELDMTPNPQRFQKCFHRRYAVSNKIIDTETTLEKGVKIYPSGCFCLKRENMENYAIHYFNGSWKDPFVRKTKFTWGKLALIQIKSTKDFSQTMQARETDLIRSDEKILFKVKRHRLTFYFVKKLICQR